MKKIIACLSLFFLISCVTSVDDVPNDVLGPAYGHIYFLINGQLKEAHKMVIDVPATGGEQELTILSNGVTSLYLGADRSDGALKLKFGKGFPVNESNYYDLDEWGQRRYLQSLIVESQPNATGVSDLNAVYFIFAGITSRYVAEIAIRQTH